MIRRLFLPALLDTEPLRDGLLVVRDGFVNLYVVRGPAGLVCFDAGWRPARVAREFGALGLDVDEIVAVFLTHLHWDHAGCAALYVNAKVYVGEREPVGLFAIKPCRSRPWTRVRDGETVLAAGLRVRVVDTPGHTPGSVCYVVDERFLITGDTLRLWRGEVVPFWPWLIGDARTMAASLRRLAVQAGMECLLTAHTGVSIDVAAAFRRWREPAAGVPSPEGHRP